MIAQTLQDKQSTRKHKSVKLTPRELTKFKALVSDYPSQDAAADAIGLGNRFNVARIMANGSGSEKYISIIRSKIGTGNTETPTMPNAQA